MATADKGFDVQKFATNLLLGGVSGVVAKTTCAPLERVKVILQVGNSGSAAVKYNGFFDAFRGVVSTQGVPALWRGNLANCLRYFPTQAMNFAFKDKYQSIFVKPKEEVGFARWFAGYLAAGGAAGATSLTVSYPLEYCYTRLAADTGAHGGVAGAKRQYSGIWDCLVKTVKSDGVRGIYRGYGPSVAGIIVYRAGYFGLYDLSKVAINIPKSEYAIVNFATSFSTALLVDIFSAMVAYPLDTIRRSLMMMSGRQDKLYTNSLQCVRYLVKQGGVPALYKGCTTNNVRAIGSALVLVIYDELKKRFLPGDHAKKHL